ncbi:MAG: hypothetical protein AAF539_08860, partial [Planctomycetota bacterium]
LKPITREDKAFTRQHAVIAGAGVLLVFSVAIAFRLFSGEAGPPWWAQLIGIICLAPPVVRIGYGFVHDAELAPYVGPELRQRVLICSGLFAALWLLYAFVPSYVLELDRYAQMSAMSAGIMFCILLAIGAAISVMVFELEAISGLAHAGMYLITCVVLAFVAGVPLAGLPVDSVF